MGYNTYPPKKMHFCRRVKIIMARTIVPKSRGYRKAFSINYYKYKGTCQQCRKIINFGDVLVSNSAKKTKYYHEICARKVMILDN